MRSAGPVHKSTEVRQVRQVERHVQVSPNTLGLRRVCIRARYIPSKMTQPPRENSKSQLRVAESHSQAADRVLLRLNRFLPSRVLHLQKVRLLPHQRDYY